MYNFYCCVRILIDIPYFCVVHSLFFRSFFFGFLIGFLNIPFNHQIEKSRTVKERPKRGKKTPNWKEVEKNARAHTSPQLWQEEHGRINSHSLTSAPNAFAFVAAHIHIIYENGNNFCVFFIPSFRLLFEIWNTYAGEREREREREEKNSKRTAECRAGGLKREWLLQTIIEIKESLRRAFFPHSLRFFFSIFFIMKHTKLNRNHLNWTQLLY